MCARIHMTTSGLGTTSGTWHRWTERHGTCGNGRNPLKGYVRSNTHKLIAADLERSKGGSYPSVSAASHLNSRLFFLGLLLFHLCTFSTVLQLQLQILKDTKKECRVRTRRSSLHPFPPNGPFPPPQNLRSHTQNRNNIPLERAFSQRWGGGVSEKSQSTAWKAHFYSVLMHLLP